VAYTHFSPSAERFARSVPADVADYLPLDLPEEVGRALDALRPDALVFSKTDVWPNLTREAAVRGVPMALLSATLPASSTRLRAPARAWLSAAYRRLDVVAAISPGDAERFAALGVSPERRTVMGDAHFDRVWARAAGVDRDSDLLRGLRAPGRVTLLAGSTWPADEDRLLTALPAAGGPRWRLVLVPHEPTPEHLRRLEARLDAAPHAHRRLGTPEPADGADVVVVDRVGILGELYAAADVAYVGGGWGTAGLHSVLEPAAFGLPVVFGPRHSNAREAAELVAAGAAISPTDAAGLRSALLDLLRDPERRRAMGAEAAAYVRAGLGAAERGAEVVERLLER
jgi:3-deoxy-D-manno-octulosonic-acid transferase